MTGSPIMTNTTESLYNSTAQRWKRKAPNSLSDYTARPRVFDLCGDVSNRSIVDLGSGEGYCARELAQRGAQSIEGIELSSQMVELAKSQQVTHDNIIHYQTGTVTDLPYTDASFDIALGVFVYNYLHVAEVYQSFADVYRVLKKGGEFIFSVPHPSFPFIKRQLSKPFYFDVENNGYFSSRDILSSGEIFCRDGTSLSVQMIPKTLEDYFGALSQAGFNSLPEIVELGVTEDMLKLDKDFFTPVNDIPLHLAIKIKK
jgi:SAM-dependent methyltransferase|tara:strand:- start:92 stop:865 length:774 start_codon:yes stop_codon:yes gene_type:complete